MRQINLPSLKILPHQNFIKKETLDEILAGYDIAQNAKDYAAQIKQGADRKILEAKEAGYQAGYDEGFTRSIDQIDLIIQAYHQRMDQQQDMINEALIFCFDQMIEKLPNDFMFSQFVENALKSLKTKSKIRLVISADNFQKFSKSAQFIRPNLVLEQDHSLGDDAIILLTPKSVIKTSMRMQFRALIACLEP